MGEDGAEHLMGDICGRVALVGSGAVLTSIMVRVSPILSLQVRGDQGGHGDKPRAGIFACGS